MSCMVLIVQVMCVPMKERKKKTHILHLFCTKLQLKSVKLWLFSRTAYEKHYHEYFKKVAPWLSSWSLLKLYTFRICAMPFDCCCCNAFAGVNAIKFWFHSNGCTLTLHLNANNSHTKRLTNGKWTFVSMRKMRKVYKDGACSVYIFTYHLYMCISTSALWINVLLCWV